MLRRLVFGYEEPAEARRVDEKLRDSTEKQAYRYWEEQRKNEIARQSETRAALAAISAETLAEATPGQLSSSGSPV